MAEALSRPRMIAAVPLMQEAFAPFGEPCPAAVLAELAEFVVLSPCEMKVTTSSVDLSEPLQVGSADRPMDRRA